tara:strand:- start:2907 stop:3881 length:975 start_codon:yes stop_codon:yes gene_type:complete
VTTGYDFQVDDLNQKELGQAFGISASTLRKQPELQAILDEILAEVAEGRTPTNADISLRIQNSDWFRGQLTSYVEAENERAKYTPELFDDLMRERAIDIVEQYEDAGADIDFAAARKYAEQMFYGSGRNEAGELQFFDNEWLADQIVDAIDFDKTKMIGGVEVYDYEGDVLSNSQLINNLANDYGIDYGMSNEGYQSWFRTTLDSVMRGDMDETDISKYMQEQAISRFPGLADAINRGQTVRAAADPYLTAIANELELPSIELDDNLVQSILNNKGPDGNWTPMSLYDTRLQARKDPRWQRTFQAKDEYTGMAQRIAQDFGFLA